jgi:FkbM family methyltransferase
VNFSSGRFALDVLNYRLKQPKGMFRASTLRRLQAMSPSDAVAAANRLLKALNRSDIEFFWDTDSEIFKCTHLGQTHYFAEKTWLRGLSMGLEYRADKLIREYFLEDIPFEDDDHVVEIGANVGDLTLSLRKLAKKVNLISFEPSPAEFRALTRNCENATTLASATPHNNAVWKNSSETLTFYLKTSTADSSLLPIEDYDNKIVVNAVSLDEVLDHRPYRFLKLEAEGAEPEILEGAKNVIKYFHYVSADVGFERGVSEESTLPQVTNFLLNNGFEVVKNRKGRLVLLFKNKNWVGAQ